MLMDVRGMVALSSLHSAKHTRLCHSERNPSSPPPIISIFINSEEFIIKSED